MQNEAAHKDAQAAESSSSTRPCVHIVIFLYFFIIYTTIYICIYLIYGYNILATITYSSNHIAIAKHTEQSIDQPHIAANGHACVTRIVSMYTWTPYILYTIYYMVYSIILSSQDDTTQQNDIVVMIYMYNISSYIYIINTSTKWSIYDVQQMEYIYIAYMWYNQRAIKPI